MDDQVLIHILETACAEESLIFQVIEQEDYLHIFINRESEQVLDYRIVGKKIYRALSRLTLTDIDGVYLYSRILGEEEPDWETRFRLPQARSKEAKLQETQPQETQPQEAKPQETQPQENLQAAQAAIVSESVQQSAPVTQPAGPAQNQTQRRISEADTFIVRGGDTAIGTQAGSLVEPESDLRSGQPSTAIPDDVTLATTARAKARAARTAAAPTPDATQYPLSDQDGAAEAAAAYEAAETIAPTVSVVAEATASEVRATEAAPSQSPKHQDASARSDADFDLTQHCFIRNRMLLTSDIVPPSKTVAKQIHAFHELPTAQKQRMMPQLELFFKGAPTFSAAELSETQQAWVKSAQALTKDDVRKLPIWLSRYCLDAEATLEVIARVLDPSLAAAKPDEAVEAEAVPHDASQDHSSQSSAPAAIVQDARTQNSSSGGAAHSISGSMAGRTAGVQRNAPSQTQSSRAAQAAIEEASAVSQWLWPGIVGIGSVILMGLGLLLAKPAAVNATACASSAAPEECQLAVQMTNSDFFEFIADSEEAEAFVAPLSSSPAVRTAQLKKATEYCNLSAASNAGQTEALSSSSALPVQSNTQEVLPGIVLADITHSSADGSGSVRTACVLMNEVWGDQPNDVELSIASESIIPTNWPAEPFVNSEQQDAELRAERAFHPLFTIGSTLLFTTVGLFAAALLRMAVVAHNFTALSQAAIAMSIFEAFFELLLPLNGLLMFPFIVARKSLALGLTGAVIPGFKVDWSGGYASVAGCVAVMVFVRFVLRWLMILTILGGNLA